MRLERREVTMAVELDAGKAVYFFDPSKHLIEVRHYEP